MIGTMRCLRAVGWLATASVLAFAAGSCLGGDEEPPSRFAEPCDGTCVDGLECIGGVCTVRCGTAMDCAPHSPTAICDSNSYCYLPCTTTFNCPSGLACTQQQTSTRMTCRPR